MERQPAGPAATKDKERGSTSPHGLRMGATICSTPQGVLGSLLITRCQGDQARHSTGNAGSGKAILGQNAHFLEILWNDSCSWPDSANRALSPGPRQHFSRIICWKMAVNLELTHGMEREETDLTLCQISFSKNSQEIPPGKPRIFAIYMTKVWLSLFYYELLQINLFSMAAHIKDIKLTAHKTI